MAMMDQEAFLRLVAEIQEQGLDEATAAHYATLIADTPIFDRDGTILVREGKRIIARLKPLKFFESTHG